MANIISQNAAQTGGRIAIGIPTSGYRKIAPFISALSDSLKESKLLPEFYVVVDRGRDRRGYISQATSLENVRAISGPQSIASRELIALNMASFSRPDCIVIINDDRWDMVNAITSFSSQIANGDGVFFGSMDIKAQKYVPYPYALACSFLSQAVSYVLIDHPYDITPDFGAKGKFVSKSSVASSLDGTFFGFFGMRPEMWRDIMNGMLERNYVKAESLSVAIEPNIQLCAAHYRTPIVKVEVPRRYEHRIIHDEKNSEAASLAVKKYARLQAERFRSAALAVANLVCRQQFGKSEHLDYFINEASRRIASSPLEWPGTVELKKSDCTMPLEFDLAYYLGRSTQQTVLAES